MGTSLSGLNADRMATCPAARSATGGSLGFVIINIQQTPHDGLASLRLNAKSDDVFPALLAALALPPLPPSARTCIDEFTHLPDRVAVPYDGAGRRLTDGAGSLRGQRLMWLDLRDGAAVKLTDGHNVQGAQQPGMMHIGKGAKGVGTVVRRDPATCSVALNIEGVAMRLGLWWIEAAARGGPARLPIVNVQPTYQPA